MLKLKNKSKLIILFFFVIVLILSSFVLIKRNDIQKLILSRLEENELETIDLTVEVKNTDENKRNCLLTFNSNDNNEKIRSIEYPTQSDETPYVIDCSENGKSKVAIDYIIEKGKEDSKFKITTTNGNIVEKTTKYTITYDSNGGDEINTESIGLKGENTFLDNAYASREGYVFLGWSRDKEATEPEINCLYEQYYTYTLGDENVKLYAVWKESNGLTGKDIIDSVANINKSEKITIYVYTKEYPVNVIYYNGNLNLDGTTTIEGATLENNVYEFGDKETDVATASENAKNMVILKVNGDLTIDEGVTLTACKSDDGYGGPKGLLIYCTGTITNNGTISMTARGAKAEGEDVILWKNSIGSYEYVPAVGATRRSKCLGSSI